MRRLATLLLAGVLVTLWPVPVEAQCGLFSTEAKCAGSRGPRLGVDFGRGITPDVARRLHTTPPPPVWQPRVDPVSTPIDCQMVREADPTIDTGLVRLPPSGMKFTMRVLEVPACPAR
jgi:hypothetical protein